MDHSCKLFYRQRVESHIVLRNQLTLMNSVGRLVDYSINFFQSRLWGGSEFFFENAFGYKNLLENVLRTKSVFIFGTSRGHELNRPSDYSQSCPWKNFAP
jgi:hypothetical protein